MTLLLALTVVLAGCTGIGGLGGDGGDGDGSGGVAEADTAGDATDGDASDDATTAVAGDGDGTDDGADEDAEDSNEGSSGDSTDTSDGDSGGDGLDDIADAFGGDGTSDGSDASDGLGAMFGDDADAEESWFNLSQPGHYEFDLAGMDEETGEQVAGRLVYDVEAASGGELTTSVDYEFGDEQYQSSTTASPDEFSAQLFLNEAYAPIGTLQSVSLMYLLEMGFTDPSVGNRKQISTEEGTRITEATEERTYAGIDCVFVETTLNDTLSQEACLIGSDGGLAPYAAIYTDEGDLELEVELVEYERR